MKLSTLQRSAVVVACAAILILGVAVIARPVAVYFGYLDLRLFLAGAQSRTVAVDGFRVHYFVLGPENGPPVVLVHGLGGRAEDWTKLAPRIARAGYRVVLPDLVGYGRSERPSSYSYSVGSEAKIVTDLIAVLGYKQVYLAGWSMGGWVVQLVAAQHPEMIRKLVLFDAAGLKEPPVWDTKLFTPTTPDELDQLNHLLDPHAGRIPGFVTADVLRVSAKNAWVVRRALHSMFQAGETTNELLPDLKMPVLIIWGSEDRILPASQAKEMHKLIPQSELLLIPDCGHLAPSKGADQSAPTVIEFLNK